MLVTSRSSNENSSLVSKKMIRIHEAQNIQLYLISLFLYIFNHIKNCYV